MIFWLLIAGMTGLAVLAVLVPLARSKSTLSAPDASDAEIYKDQLQEVAREVERGVLTADEAEGARIEISRRLLHAVGNTPAQSTEGALMRQRVAAGLGLVLVPLIGLGGYLLLGSPGNPAQPLSERRAQTLEQQDVQTLMARVEVHLAANPNDGKGWALIAPVYARFGRYQDAAAAYARAIELLGADAERQSGLGEALMRVAGGIVTQDAKQAFETALVLDPTSPRARYYLALASAQDGRKDDALKQLQALAASAEPGAPWLKLIEAEIARISGAAVAPLPPVAISPAPQAPGPSADDMAAAQNMSPQDRAGMIQGMVDRLAARLQSNSDDPDGWVRLIRAYAVMGDKAKAQQTLDAARAALRHRPESAAALDALAGSLGLGS